MFDDFFVRAEKGIIEFDPKSTFFFAFFQIGSLSPIILVKHKERFFDPILNCKIFFREFFLGVIFFIAWLALFVGDF